MVAVAVSGTALRCRSVAIEGGGAFVIKDPLEMCEDAGGGDGPATLEDGHFVPEGGCIVS